MSSEFYKNIIEPINAEKEMISELIKPHLLQSNLSPNEIRQKRQELIDIGKFITASKENIKILNAHFTIPDLLIEWDNVKYGLEHTEVIDQKKKDTFEKTHALIKEAERIFLERYGDINKQINFSLKFEITKITEKEKRKLLNKLLIDYKNLNWEPQKLMNLAHPGFLTAKDIKIVAGQLADMAHLAIENEGQIFRQVFNNDLINYISLRPSKKILFTRSVGWSAGTLSDLIIQCIDEKEAKIKTYIQNTSGLKQCLFLLIQGSNGYSDYAYFDDKILQSRGSTFDKVIAFNFFTNEFFFLK